MTMRGSEPDRGELGRLLREAGSAYDPQGVEALIEGVLASPPEIGTSWHMLVADPIIPALAGALEALRAAKAKGYRNGLAAEDFARLPRAARLDRLRKFCEEQGHAFFSISSATGAGIQQLVRGMADALALLPRHEAEVADPAAPVAAPGADADSELRSS